MAGSDKCFHCGGDGKNQWGVTEFFNYEGGNYCLPCQQQLESDGTAPWDKKDKCVKCSKKLKNHELHNVEGEKYCSTCYHKKRNESPPSNNQNTGNNQPTNYLPYILGGMGVMVVIIGLVWLVSRNKDKAN